MKSFIALVALVAAVSAEAQWGLNGHLPYAAAPLAAHPYAAAAPLALPKAQEEPTGFYYHVQTYDKKPVAPVTPLAYNYPAYNYANALPAVNYAGYHAAAAPYNYDAAFYGHNWAAAPWAYNGYNNAAAWNGAFPAAYPYGFPAIKAVEAEKME